jgi:hypothetical protein
VASTPELGGRHEPPFVATWTVVGVVVGWLVFVALSLWMLGAVWPKTVVPPMPATTTFPAPRLQADPTAEYERLRAQQLARLGAYAWVDRDAGIVQIPIERAIDLLAARGNDAYGPLEPPPPPSPAETARATVDAAGQGLAAPAPAGDATSAAANPAIPAPTSTVPSGGASVPAPAQPAEAPKP